MEYLGEKTITTKKPTKQKNLKKYNLHCIQVPVVQLIICGTSQKKAFYQI